MPRSRSPQSPICFLPFMHPSSAEAAPEGTQWLHEVKYDGYRTELVIAQPEVRAFTRNGFDWTDRYGPVISSARALRCHAALCTPRRGGFTRPGGARHPARMAGAGHPFRALSRRPALRSLTFLEPAVQGPTEIRTCAA